MIDATGVIRDDDFEPDYKFENNSDDNLNTVGESELELQLSPDALKLMRVVDFD